MLMHPLIRGIKQELQMCKLDSPLAQILVSGDYLAPKREKNPQEQNNKVSGTHMFKYFVVY